MNRRWWRDEGVEEAILLEGGKEGAIFLTKEKLGVDPESRGFTKERVRVDRKQVRVLGKKAYL